MVVIIVFLLGIYTIGHWLRPIGNWSLSLVFLLSHDAKLAQILHTNYVEDILIFPPKWCHVGLALICHFLFLDKKAVGPIFGSHPIQ
jgi:hypothetical protein